MSTRAQAAATRIREQVPILKVLSALGYDVRDDGGDREQQFRCDLHGTGYDNKPSARVYPDSNSWYCFGCGVARDPIETLRAKQGVGFWKAVQVLEQAFGLDPLPIDYGADEKGEGALHEMAGHLGHQVVSYEDEEERTRRLLNARTLDRDLPLDRLLAFWEAFDKVVFHVRGPHGDGGVWTEARGKQMLAGLRDRINDWFKEQHG